MSRSRLLEMESRKTLEKATLMISKRWGLLLISIILISFVSWGLLTLNTEHQRVIKIDWSDIGHVTYVLPLFNGQQWLYRYDIKTNAHGNITLREDGLPQPNIVITNMIWNACAYTSFIHPLTINETIGLTFYTNCGYLVIPQS